jgi:hypothetical protein
MIVLRDPAQLPRVADPEIRDLIARRIKDLSQDEPWNADVLGDFIVVEPGDSLASLDQQLGFALLTSRTNGARFGDPDYMPAHEILEEYAGCYEIVIILSDDGYGVEVFVPKVGADPQLLALCAHYATFAATD